MYEWENKVTANQIESRKHYLREEIKRITETTLRGTFVNQEDRDFWVARARKLNSELAALEGM